MERRKENKDYINAIDGLDERQGGERNYWYFVAKKNLKNNKKKQEKESISRRRMAHRPRKNGVNERVYKFGHCRGRGNERRETGL